MMTTLEGGLDARFEEEPSSAPTSKLTVYLVPNTSYE